MRALGVREFVSQHYGYGRGALAFHRSLGTEEPRAERWGVLRELARETRRRHDRHSRLAIAAYVALSQLATAAGFAREAVGDRLTGR
jgi:hypothetical protein